MVRQFRLINANGDELDLMARTHFFHSPSGLGYGYEYTTQTAGYDFLTTDSLLSQKTVSGEVVFLGAKPYQDYQDFVSFCAKTPLKLAYMPDNTWYYLNVQVQTLQKTEITTGLICPVDFLAFGTWYKQTVVTQSEMDASAGKVYDYTYNYTYAETAVGTAVIVNSGDLPAYVKLHIMGPCVNPTWALEHNGEVVARGAVTASIDTGNKLVVDSAPATLEIAEYTTNNAYVRNLYQSSDFSTARFMLAPVGESTLTFSNSGSADINAYVEVSALAESV